LDESRGGVEGVQFRVESALTEPFGVMPMQMVDDRVAISEHSASTSSRTQKAVSGWSAMIRAFVVISSW
jgi:hypothetical protein